MFVVLIISMQNACAAYIVICGMSGCTIFFLIISLMAQFASLILVIMK